MAAPGTPTTERHLRRPAWLTLGALAVVVVALGFWGLSLAQSRVGTPDPVTTRWYRTLQLFVLEGGDVPGPLPWQLEVARVMAPLLSAYTVLLAVAATFGEQLDGWRLRRIRGHVVVVGLGALGTTLCHDLVHQGRRVVGVDLRDTGPSLRGTGVLVVRGDARREAVLRRAGVLRADRLVVACGDDDVTVEVVATARAVAGARRTPDALRCVGVLRDPGFWTVLVCQEMDREPSASVEVDFVDPLAAGAAMLVRDRSRGHGAAAPRVTITGDGEVAAAVLLALARCVDLDSGSGGRPRVVLDAGAAWLEQMVRSHRELDRLHLAIEGAGAGRQVEGLGDRATARPGGEVRTSAPDERRAVVYVCDDDDRSALTRALTLSRTIVGDRQLVLVRRRVTSVVALLARTGPEGPQLMTAGLLEMACRPELLLGGTTELLARALHAEYVEQRTEEGRGDDPAARPWETLAESLRASNRAHAGELAAGLRSVGRGVGPLGPASGSDSLDEAEVEVLAQQEHRRWVAERRAAGWRPGPRDPVRRTTPYLVPWEELSDEVRDYDRLFVRRLPRVLAAVGLGVLPPRDGGTGRPPEPEGPRPAGPLDPGGRSPQRLD